MATISEPLRGACAIAAAMLVASCGAWAQAASAPAPASGADAAPTASIDHRTCPGRPLYPIPAMRARATGDTQVHVTVAPDGSVVAMHVARTSGGTAEHDLLDQAALKALDGCGFRLSHPTTAPVDTFIDFEWKLDGEPGPPTGRQLDDLRQQAAAGTPGAAWRLYLALPREDAEEGLRALRAAADAGNPMALYERARRQAIGEGMPRDLAAALSGWEALAGKGDRRAMRALVDHHLDGVDGAPPHPELAAPWLRRLADDERPDDMLRYGDLLRDGRGVPRDDAQAVEWYRRAARQGQADAFGRLGDAFLAGRGVRADRQAAADFYLLEYRLWLQQGGDHLPGAFTAQEVAAAHDRAMPWRRGQPLPH